MFEGEGKTILDIEEISNCSFHVLQEVIISLIATCIRLHFLLQYSLFVVFLLLLIGSSRDELTIQFMIPPFPLCSFNTIIRRTFLRSKQKLSLSVLYLSEGKLMNI